MSATTIDEVIEQLTEIIEYSKKRDSRLGYFPALYRKVTVAVKRGIQEGFFEDGARMEQLDVVFANRYLDAFNQYRSGKMPTRSWHLAFDAAQSRKTIVLQHLLLGINTHINLDLGIAAAVIMRGKSIYLLKSDFKKINDILASMIEEVMTELGTVSPLMKRFDLLFGTFDEYLARFGIEIAREYAWQVAIRFSEVADDDWSTMTDKLDISIVSIGEQIRNPGRWWRFVLFLVRMREWKSVRRIIEVLE